MTLIKKDLDIPYKSMQGIDNVREFIDDPLIEVGAEHNGAESFYGFREGSEVEIDDDVYLLESAVIARVRDYRNKARLKNGFVS